MRSRDEARRDCSASTYPPVHQQQGDGVQPRRTSPPRSHPTPISLPDDLFQRPALTQGNGGFRCPGYCHLAWQCPVNVIALDPVSMLPPCALSCLSRDRGRGAGEQYAKHPATGGGSGCTQPMATSRDMHAISDRAQQQNRTVATRVTWPSPPCKVAHCHVNNHLPRCDTTR